jgi:hypothetical protein
LSTQEEINLLFDEHDAAESAGRAGAIEQRKLALDIKARWTELKEKIRYERSRSQTRQPLPASLISALKKLKTDVVAFRRLWNAAPAFHQVVATQEARAPAIRKALVARIDSDLARRSRVMLDRLGEIAENNELIEVEIYNGASQDIIWQNAHPDYKEIAERMKDQAKKSSSDKVWNWGRTVASDSEEGGEIWEDELGSFKADLVDNCSSKDKYLAIRRNH